MPRPHKPKLVEDRHNRGNLLAVIPIVQPKPIFRRIARVLPRQVEQHLAQLLLGKGVLAQADLVIDAPKLS